MQPLYDVYTSLVFSATTRDGRATIVDGRLVTRDGVPLNADMGAAIAGVRAAGARLAAHVGLPPLEMSGGHAIPLHAPSCPEPRSNPMSRISDQPPSPPAAASLASDLAIAAGAWASRIARAAGEDIVNAQLSWRLSNNQLGEIAAMKLGYYEAEGIELKMQPGGPSNDGVAIVASGRANVGQLSSSPSLLLAVSQGIPAALLRLGAAAAPVHLLLPAAGAVRRPQDMVGKRVGIQATARPLLRGMLLRNGLKESDVKITVIGAELAPLLTGPGRCRDRLDVERARRWTGPDRARAVE